jgi:hypothetical protein
MNKSKNLACREDGLLVIKTIRKSGQGAQTHADPHAQIQTVQYTSLETPC